MCDGIEPSWKWFNQIFPYIHNHPPLPHDDLVIRCYPIRCYPKTIFTSISCGKKNWTSRPTSNFSFVLCTLTTPSVCWSGPERFRNNIFKLIQVPYNPIEQQNHVPQQCFHLEEQHSLCGMEELQTSMMGDHWFSRKMAFKFMGKRGKVREVAKAKEKIYGVN